MLVGACIVYTLAGSVDSAGAVFTVWSCLERVGSALLDARILGNLLHLQAFVPPGKTEDLMSDCAFRGSHT